MPEDTPTISTSDGQLHQWCLGLQEDVETRRNPLEGQWWENLATYCGDLWVEWDPHRKRLWEPKKKENYKVRIPINTAQPLVRTELAKLTKNRPITDVMASGPDLASINSAKVGNKILNHYVEKTFMMARVRRRALNWMGIAGTAGIFVDYDDSLSKPIELYKVQDNIVTDMRIVKAYQQKQKKGGGKSLKKMMIPQGDLVIKAVAPFQLGWDFSAIYPEDSWWMIISDVFDVNTIKRRWKKDVDGEEDAEPGIIEKRLIAKMDVTGTIKPPKPKYQEMARVYRLFVKPGHPYFPDGAEIVFTRDEILEKKKHPFTHGGHPVSVMGHIANPSSQYDMSILQQAKPVVLELSKTLSQMIENRNMCANPPWLEPIQARIEEEIKNRPGLRLKYNHVPNVPPPQPIQMPDMPLYVKELPETLRQLLQDISGQGDVSSGQVPAGARSGVALAYLEEQDDTKLGPTVTEFEECMERSSWQILQVITQKYSIPRTITLYRKHGDPEVMDFYGEMLSGCAGVEVQAGSALPKSKAARQQFILDLWDRKLEQDPRRVREMLELSEGEPDEWELDLDQAERENKKLKGGAEIPVKTWENHNAHLYKHHQQMKTAEYESWNPDIQAVHEDHCREHEEELTKQQQATAMQNPEGGDEAGFGQQNQEGAPPQFSSQQSPRGLAAQEPE